VLRAIMAISARAFSLADRPRLDHLGHQCSHAPGRPILHRCLILSQTSAGKGCWLRHRSFLTSPCSFVRAWRSFLCPGLRAQTRRAQRAVKAGRRAVLTSCSTAARPRLDGPSIERPLPASRAGRAGARPDHPISGHRRLALCCEIVALGPRRQRVLATHGIARDDAGLQAARRRNW
jgi:hypothetical protein